MSAPSPEGRPTLFREGGVIALFLLTLLYVGVVFLTPGSPARIPLGFVELVFVPGYALGAILFVRRPLLPPAAEFAVAVGLSVVFNVLVGLILALVGPGLAVTWLVIADTAAISLGLVVKVLARDGPGEAGVSGAIRREFRLPGIQPAYRTAVYALLVAALLAFAGVIYLGVTFPHATAPASVAVYGPGGTTQSLPRNLTVGQVAPVVLTLYGGSNSGPFSLGVNATQAGREAGTLPESVVYDSGTSELFVANGVGTVSVISDTTFAVVATISVGPGAAGLTYDASVGEIFVTNSAAGTVSVISDATNSVLASFAVETTPMGIAYVNATGDVFVANYGSGNVTVNSASTPYSPVSTIPLGGNPAYLAYDSGTGDVYAVNFGSDTVSVISGTTYAIEATIPVGSNPLGVAYDSGTGDVYVANSGSDTVSVISDLTNTVVASVPVGGAPTGVAYASTTGEIFVTNNATNTVSVISDATNAVLANIPVDTGPTGAAFDNRTGQVFVANYVSSTAVTISTMTDTVVGTIPLGKIPWSLPLPLIAGASSSLPLALGKGQQTTVDMTFDFAQEGNYSVAFALQFAGGAPLPEASVFIHVGLVSSPSVSTILLGGDPALMVDVRGPAHLYAVTLGSTNVGGIADAANADLTNTPVLAFPTGAAFGQRTGQVLVANYLSPSAVARIPRELTPASGPQPIIVDSSSSLSLALGQESPSSSFVTLENSAPGEDMATFSLQFAGGTSHPTATIPVNLGT
ncbi:MAG: DUF1616 domain-containing protein [Thermoplasmata archaeon]